MLEMKEHCESQLFIATRSTVHIEGMTDALQPTTFERAVDDQTLHITRPQRLAPAASGTLA